MKQKSVIREMFWGEKGIYENVPSSDDFKETQSKMYNAIDRLLENLSPKQKELFDEAYDFICDNDSENAADHFTQGFKLGLLIGIECFKDQL